MFTRFRWHHRHDHGDDFGHRHWSRWLRGRHSRFGMFEGRNEQRARRGDVKFIVLAALNEKPMHGYDIIQTLEQQYGGRYRPSPGSIYPTLQMLEDGGFVISEQIDGKRVYTITDEGRKLLADRDKSYNDSDEDASDTDWGAMRDSARQFIAAVRQGVMHENPKVREQMRSIVDEARKKIYKVLSEEA